MYRFEALLYYLYTGDVEFAPLKSEGEEARKRLIEDYTTRYPFRPRPCSCKSMYRLASQVGGFLAGESKKCMVIFHLAEGGASPSTRAPTPQAATQNHHHRSRDF